MCFINPVVPVHCCCAAVQHLDARLGVEVVYRDYGTACDLISPSTHSLNWPVLRATLLDEFVLAHSLGWWAKALLIRNTGLLWVCSVGFELLELTFAVRRVGRCLEQYHRLVLCCYNPIWFMAGSFSGCSWQRPDPCNSDRNDRTAHQWLAVHLSRPCCATYWWLCLQAYSAGSCCSGGTVARHLISM